MLKCGENSLTLKSITKPQNQWILLLKLLKFPLGDVFLLVLAFSLRCHTNCLFPQPQYCPLKH